MTNRMDSLELQALNITKLVDVAGLSVKRNMIEALSSGNVANYESTDAISKAVSEGRWIDVIGMAILNWHTDMQAYLGKDYLDEIDLSSNMTEADSSL